MDKEYEQYVKLVLDDLTFMLFDLERGSFLSPDDGSIEVPDGYTVKYKRVVLEEILRGNMIDIISDFYISVSYEDADIIKYETRGNLRKFTVYTFDGPICAKFLLALEAFRIEKFSINTK